MPKLGTHGKDRKEIALYNTSRSLGKKYVQTRTDEDYQRWQKALKNYIEYENINNK